ncbi:MAG: family 43 glycosylhydrolase [Muribaculaceae bacterium]
MKKLIFSALLAAAIAGGANAQTYTNPVFSTYWGSPNINVIRGDDGNYYGFIHEGWGRYSSNLADWADAYRVADEATHYGTYTIKQPSVHKVGNRYIMYYEAYNTSTNTGEAICVNVSDKPGGYYSPWGGNGSAQSIILHMSSLGIGGVWDPSYIRDPSTGRHYLIYSGSERGICAVELAADGLSIAPGAQHIQLTGLGITQPSMYYHDGYFYLFATYTEQMAPINGWTTTTNKVIVVGRSESPTGPYVDAAGRRMLDGYYHQVMAGHPFRFTDPEKPSFVTDDAGQEWVIYNAWQVGADNVDPIMMLDKVRWKDGWPVLGDGYPSYYPVARPKR